MRKGSARRRLTWALFAIGCAAGARGASVDFESVRPGTRWGVESGQQPGDSALSEGDIMMSLETFHFSPTQTDFFRAEVPDVGGRFVGAFPSQELTLDGISVRFDFSMLRFDVDFASLEFVDFGGTTNVAVNDGEVHILNPLTGIPSTVAPGVTAFVVGGSKLQFVASGVRIESLLIGGQELAIDNVIAVPDAATWLLLMAGATALIRRRTPRK